MASEVAIWLRKVRASQTASSAKEPDDLDAASRSINLISPIKYDDDNSVRESIKEECALPSMTEAHIFEQAEREEIAMKSLSSYDNIGVALRVIITDADGRAGGAYTGMKEVDFHVDLFRDGKIVASNDFNRRTRGGISIHSAALSSCRILDKLTKTFSVKVVKWAMEELSMDPPDKKSHRERKRAIREKEQLAEKLGQQDKPDQKEDVGKNNWNTKE